MLQNTDTIQAAIAALPDADPWSICWGHDLIGLLRIGLQHVLSDLKSSRGVGDIIALLRAAFDKGELNRSGFGRSIRG